MLYGTTRSYTRERLHAQVLTGFYPTEPIKLSSLAAPIDDSGIKSGMVVIKDVGEVDGVANQEGFRPTATGDALLAGKSFYIALHDADAHDVQEAGKLVGLDCSDTFEIQTGYFDKTAVWAVDDAVTVGAGGILAPAVTGNVIIGYITAVGAGVTAADPGIKSGTIVYNGHAPGTANVLDAEMIQFKTSKNGQTAA